MLDPRIARLFPASNLGQQFLAMGLLALLDQAKLTDKVLSAMNTQAGIDYKHVIDGRSVLYFLNKSEQKLRNEGIPQATIDKVKSYFKQFDFSLAEERGEPPSEHAAAIQAAAAVPKQVKVASGEITGDGSGKELPPGDDTLKESEPGAEPVFAGKPLSELEKLTDEQLLAIENVGPGTVKKIREASKAKASAK